MRAASLILCIYFMLLSIMPCSDVEECMSASQTSISALTDHGNHSHESEMCSPFCVCACCGQDAPIPFDNLVLGGSIRHSAPMGSHYPSGFAPGFYLAIWQPPKIG